MYEQHRVSHIDQINIKPENEIELTDIVKRGEWEKHVHEILNEVTQNPDWLIDPALLPQEKIDQIKRGLDLAASKQPKDLSELLYLLGDEKVTEAIVVRFMEIFSQKFSFTHIYRGGSLNDLIIGLHGSFSFLPDVAKGFIERSHKGERENPCLFALPVSSFVDFYKQSQDSVTMVQEQGFDGMFSSSIQMHMIDHIPDDLTIYVLEGENPESNEVFDLEKAIADNKAKIQRAKERMAQRKREREERRRSETVKTRNQNES